jgi:hypothetical protein
MSKQALDSEKVWNGLKDVLLGPAQLYEALRARGDSTSGQIPRRTDLPQVVVWPHLIARIYRVTG